MLPGSIWVDDLWPDGPLDQPLGVTLIRHEDWFSWTRVPRTWPGFLCKWATLKTSDFLLGIVTERPFLMQRLSFNSGGKYVFLKPNWDTVRVGLPLLSNIPLSEHISLKKKQVNWNIVIYLPYKCYNIKPQYHLNRSLTWREKILWLYAPTTSQELLTLSQPHLYSDITVKCVFVALNLKHKNNTLKFYIVIRYSNHYNHNHEITSGSSSGRFNGF